MIATVTLNPAIDCVVKVEEFRAGCLNRVSEEAVFPGGKGVNVSLVLAELDVDTCVSGFLAGTTGKAYEAMLAERNLKDHFLFVDSGFTRINTKVSSQEETEINGIGPALTFADLDRLCSKLRELPDLDMLVLS